MEIKQSSTMYFICALLLLFSQLSSAFAENNNQLENISAAKKLYTQAVPMQVDSPERAKLLEQSATILNKVIEKNPQSLEAHRKLMGVYLLQQDYTKGIRTIQEAINLSPEDPKLFITLAFLYEHSGAFEYSIAMLDQALALDPKNSLAKQYKKKIKKKIDKSQMEGLHQGKNITKTNHGQIIMSSDHEKSTSIPHSAKMNGK